MQTKSSKLHINSKLVSCLAWTPPPSGLQKWLMRIALPVLVNSVFVTLFKICVFTVDLSSVTCVSRIAMSLVYVILHLLH